MNVAVGSFAVLVIRMHFPGLCHFTRRPGTGFPIYPRKLHLRTYNYRELRPRDEVALQRISYRTAVTFQDIKKI
jgi:hypothetical protein